MSQNEGNSSMRYLLARLKPFGRIVFWGPLGLLSLGLIFYWQYQEHPEWLNQISEQPETLDSYFRSPDIPIPETNTLQPNPQIPQQPTNNPNDPNAGHWATEWKKGLTQEQLVPYSVNNPKGTNKPTTTQPNSNQTSSLFRPLLPPVKPSQEPTEVKPYQVQSAPISENYLKTAVDRIPTSNPSSYYNPSPVIANPTQTYYNPNPTYSSVNQPVNPNVTGYQQPYTGSTNPAVPNPAYPNTQTYQQPTYSPYARPAAPTYPQQPQAYQQPTNPNSVVISGNSATQPNYQIQPTINARPAGF